MSSSSGSHQAVLMEALTGQKVRLTGLSKRQDLNGSGGLVKAYVPSKQRYVVELEDGTSATLRPENLEASQELPSLYTALVGADNGRTAVLGRSRLPSDLLSIFMERCRLETDNHDSRVAPCATCHKKSASIVCGGCKLCQWCSSDCQRQGVEGGHGELCRQYRALRSIYDDPTIKEATKLAHSSPSGLIAGNDMATNFANQLSREVSISSEQAKTLELACRNAVVWPASAEMATCSPGSKVQLSRTELQMPSTGNLGRLVPGKLTFCATGHKSRVKKLSKSELQQEYTLPCGQNPIGGLSKGLTADISHAPVKASLKDLTIRSIQQILCNKGCNTHDSPFGSGKATLSNVFYSFCLERTCNDNGLPGAVTHCPMCGLCRDYMYSHTSCCNKCSYGSNMKTMPCMHCHDLVLAHDGVVFVPHRQCISQVPAFAAGMAALVECKCGNGNTVWLDGSPNNLRKHLEVLNGSEDRVNEKATAASDPTGSSRAEMDAHTMQVVEAFWDKAENDPVERVDLIDKVFLHWKHDESVQAGKGFVPPPTTSSVPPALEASGEMYRHSKKVYGELVKRLKDQYQADDHNSSKSFEEWLIEERDKAVVAARAEYRACRRTGRLVDKRRYKTVLADRCDCCGEKATEFKHLLVCSRCQEAFYCDESCQLKDWKNHKAACKQAAKETKAKGK